MIRRDILVSTCLTTCVRYAGFGYFRVYELPARVFAFVARVFSVGFLCCKLLGSWGVKLTRKVAPVPLPLPLLTVPFPSI